MMENKIQNGQRPVYEPLKVQVQQINPAGVLCQSGGNRSMGEIELNADDFEQM